MESSLSIKENFVISLKNLDSNSFRKLTSIIII